MSVWGIHCDRCKEYHEIGHGNIIKCLEVVEMINNGIKPAQISIKMHTPTTMVYAYHHRGLELLRLYECYPELKGLSTRALNICLKYKMYSNKRILEEPPYSRFWRGAVVATEICNHFGVEYPKRKTSARSNRYRKTEHTRITRLTDETYDGLKEIHNILLKVADDSGYKTDIIIVKDMSGDSRLYSQITGINTYVNSIKKLMKELLMLDV